MDPSPSLLLPLPDEAATLAFGRVLAAIMADPVSRVTLLLRGGLGSGKTTLVRGLVLALPGGTEAEVASPSFNIVNIYPTRPEIIHADLYRIAGCDPCVEDYLETAAEQDALVIVEWADYLPAALLPPDRLDLDWLPSATGRLCRVTATGQRGWTALEALKHAVSDITR